MRSLSLVNFQLGLAILVQMWLLAFWLMHQSSLSLIRPPETVPGLSDKGVNQRVGSDDRQALPKLLGQESQPECVKGNFLKKAELS